MNNDLSQKYRDEMMRYYDMQKKNNTAPPEEMNMMRPSNTAQEQTPDIAVNTMPFPDTYQQSVPAQTEAADVPPEAYETEPPMIENGYQPAAPLPDMMQPDDYTQQDIYIPSEMPENYEDEMPAQNVPPLPSTIYGQPNTYNNVSVSSINTEDIDYNAFVSDRYPDPDLPDYIASPEDQPSAGIPAASDRNSYGRLRIEVSSGNHANPIEDALIVVTRGSGTDKDLIGILLTDSSGETQTLEISAPSRELSESPSNRRVNAVVDIIAYKKGYYEVENRNVPIFSGVTSIQSVNMVPLPLNSPEQKMIFTENKPNL